jgi:hypothetical protein
MSERAWKPPARPDRGISALEPAHIAAFAAFQRPVGHADKGLCTDPEWLGRLGEAQARFDINPSLARRVCAGAHGTVYLVPGAETLCYISVAANGATFIGTTLTAAAAKDGLVHVQGGNGPARTLVGVVPAGGHDLRVVDRADGAVAVPLSPDDSYCITIADPVDMYWTRRDGTTHQSRPGLFKQRRIR